MKNPQRLTPPGAEPIQVCKNCQEAFRGPSGYSLCPQCYILAEEQLLREQPRQSRAPKLFLWLVIVLIFSWLILELTTPDVSRTRYTRVSPTDSQPSPRSIEPTDIIDKPQREAPYRESSWNGHRMRTYKVNDSADALYWVIDAGNGRIALYYVENSESGKMMALNGPALTLTPENDYRKTHFEEMQILLEDARQRKLNKPW